MKIRGNRTIFLVGIIWVGLVFVLGAAFLGGNPHYFEEGNISGILFLNIVGFILWSIPGFVLIILGNWKHKNNSKKSLQ